MMQNTDSVAEVRIRYQGTASGFHIARVVHTWRYDDSEILRGPVMSTSSGEKDYLKNLICHLFSMGPAIFSITMLVLNGTPFLVLKLRDGRYLDAATQRDVEVRSVEKVAEAAA